METVPEPRKKGQRSWTDAQRAEQGRRMHERQIWLKSTGPKTPNGKRTSSRNAYKHGSYSYEGKVLKWYVRLAAMRNKQIKTRLNYLNQIRENELRNKYNIPHPSRPDIMAFYPYFKVHPLAPKPKKLTQRQKDKEIYDYLDSLSKE